MGGALVGDLPQQRRPSAEGSADGSADGGSAAELRLLAGLNPSQKEAVSAPDVPVLVVAGPGSGKTRVLTHRAAMLLVRGASPSQLLVVTFTNKAASELRERLAVLVGAEVSERLWVATFHAACARILRSYGDRVGLPRSFSIFDTADTSRLLRQQLTVAGVPPDADHVKQVRAEISRCKNRLVSAEDLAVSQSRADRMFAETLAAYDAELRGMGAVDFDDLLLLAVRLLEQDQDVRAEYHRRLRHVLVDEYQDTNATQARLLELLVDGRRSIFVVGDAQQSIYSWRGAEPAVMRSFPDSFPGGTRVVLSHNYRSTEPILQVARAIIAPVRDELLPGLACADDSKLVADPVRLLRAADDRDEASWVVGDLAGRSGSTAVLMRTNSQSRSFEETLVSAGVPYQVVGALRFYDRAEVKDALSYLRLLANPFDRVAFARAAAAPKRGLGEAALSRVEAAAELLGGDQLAAARALAGDPSVSARLRRPLSELMDQLDAVAAAAARSPEEALRAVAEETGLRAALESDRSSVDRAENLDELVASARSFAASRQHQGLSPSQLMEAFLENAALVSSADLDADDADAAVSAQVQLLTVHAAKGREFDQVYVVGVEDGFFPHTRAVSADDRAEERRLLFVACSRPRRLLTLSWAESRFMFSQRQQRSPSPFLVDLPEEVVSVRFGGRGDSWRHGSGSSASWRSGARTSGRGWSEDAAVGRGGAARPARSVAAAAAAPPGPRLAPDQVPAGTLVAHPKFGSGEVISCVEGRASIRFPGGVKLLDLQFAPLSLSAAVD